MDINEIEKLSTDVINLNDTINILILGGLIAIAIFLLSSLITILLIFNMRQSFRDELMENLLHEQDKNLLTYDDLNDNKNTI